MLSLEVFAVKIDRLEKEVNELRLEQKEDRKVLLENVVRQTALMEKMEQRAEKQDQRLDKMDEKLDQVNIDVQTIKVRSENSQLEDKGNDSIGKMDWYQSFITNDRKFLWLIFLIILGAVLGIKTPDILSFFKLMP